MRPCKIVEGWCGRGKVAGSRDEDGLIAERNPGVVTETELACVERDEAVGLADLGLRLDDVATYKAK